MWRSRLVPRREAAGDNIVEGYARKFPWNYNHGRLPRRRIPRNALRRLRCYRARPDDRLGNRVRKLVQSRSREKDLRPRLRTCAPNGRPARYPPLAKTPSGLRRRTLLAPRHELFSPPAMAPKLPQARAELEM